MNKSPRPIRTLLRDGVDEPRLQEIWQRVEARRDARKQTRRVLVPALAACCAALLALTFVREQRTARDGAIAAREPLVLADGAVLPTALEVSAHAPERVIALSDGTRITLGAGGRLVPRTSTSARFELAVERGRARFEVQPQRGRAFVVSAGSLRVEVVGTVFSVEHGERDAAVVVEHGRVRVHTGDASGTERVLGAGDTLRWPTGVAEVPAQTAPLAPLVPDAPVVPDAPAMATPTHVPAGPDAAGAVRPALAVASPAFRAAVASGEYARAYGLLGVRGYARAVRSETEIDALLQLADVARGAGKSRAAALALSRIIELYPQGDRSALAALTLGRLQLDVLGQPAGAARALRIALAAGLPVALQEDALARLVDACARAGHTADAELAAEQYRRRFPNGRWRTSVEQWVNAR